MSIKTLIKITLFMIALFSTIISLLEEAYGESLLIILAYYLIDSFVVDIVFRVYKLEKNNKRLEE